MWRFVQNLLKNIRSSNEQTQIKFRLKRIRNLSKIPTGLITKLIEWITNSNYTRWCIINALRKMSKSIGKTITNRIVTIELSITITAMHKFLMQIKLAFGLYWLSIVTKQQKRSSLFWSQIETQMAKFISI